MKNQIISLSEKVVVEMNTVGMVLVGFVAPCTLMLLFNNLIK